MQLVPERVVGPAKTLASGVGFSGCAIDIRVDTETSNAGENRLQARRRAHANTELVARDRTDPGAHLPAIGAKIEASNDLAVGLDVAVLHGTNKVTKHARLAGQWPGCERETLRLLDGVGSRENGGGKLAQFAADPHATPNADQPADELAPGGKARLVNRRLQCLAVESLGSFGDGIESLVVFNDAANKSPGGL